MKPSQITINFSAFGDSYQTFGRVISKQQSYQVDLKCENSKCPKKTSITTTSNQFFYSINSNNVYKPLFYLEYFCDTCKSVLSEKSGAFVSNPAWLYFDMNYRQTNTRREDYLTCNHLEKESPEKVQNLTFQLLVAQIIFNENKSSAHFKGLFLIDDKFYLIDDLQKGKRLYVPKKHKVTSCLYYLV